MCRKTSQNGFSQNDSSQNDSSQNDSCQNDSCQNDSSQNDSSQESSLGGRGPGGSNPGLSGCKSVCLTTGLPEDGQSLAPKYTRFRVRTCFQNCLQIVAV